MGAKAISFQVNAASFEGAKKVGKDRICYFEGGQIVAYKEG